jgi:hypothetical protein
MTSSTMGIIFSDIMNLYGDMTVSVLTFIFGLGAVLIAVNVGWKKVKRKVGPIR